jgi:sulfur carrier protein
MSAKLIYRKKEYTIRHGMTVRSALQKMDISTEAVIAVKNGEVITDDEIIAENDVIQLLSVLSGGG